MFRDAIVFAAGVDESDSQSVSQSFRKQIYIYSILGKKVIIRTVGTIYSQQYKVFVLYATNNI